jgi:hypothetical protein
MKKWKRNLIITISVIVFIYAVFVAFYFITQHTTYTRRIEQLNNFPDFADDGTQVTFSFDLNRRDLYMDLIEEFGLDEITAGYEDVALMRVLLNWVTTNFPHHGNSGMPVNRYAMSIVGYVRENPSGINCRGLAILLAEVLRLYGIEAKHITVMAPEDDYPVHVITHAFSRELQQWIVLDPTFGVYLRDEDGNFMNLYTLRHAFAEGAPLIANADGRGHFNGRFNMRSFRQFTADYLFRFSTGTHFGFGSEHNDDDNLFLTLVPYGFSMPYNSRIFNFTTILVRMLGGGNSWIEPDILTTSADAFFAIPQ